MTNDEMMNNNNHDNNDKEGQMMRNGKFRCRHVEGDGMGAEDVNYRGREAKDGQGRAEVI